MGESVIGIVFMFLIGVIFYKGFCDMVYFECYVFDVDKILIDKEYWRLISLGFLYGGWFYLGFNLIVLIFFSVVVEF